MKTTTDTTPRLFLTDYASYNNGTQFEFGHWVDLSQFSDAEEFQEYITKHFAECDEKSPLDSPREETMFTDFEGFPEHLYSESMSVNEMETLFKYLALDWENKTDSEKLDEWNEYCSEDGNPDDQIFDFGDDFFDTFFNNKPMEAARAATFGSINWSDNYIRFNGYGNLESTDSPMDFIDEQELINWLIERS